MSEQKTAFAFWREKSTQSLPDTARVCPKPALPPKPSLRGRSPVAEDPDKSHLCKARPEIPPFRPPKPAKPVKPVTSSPSSSSPSSFLQKSVQGGSVKSKVPLLPPGSSWKPKPSVPEKPVRTDSSPKSVALPTRESYTATPRRRDDKPPTFAIDAPSSLSSSDKKRVSKMIEKLNFEKTISVSSHVPHSVPATSKEREFLLPKPGSEGVKTEGDEGKFSEGGVKRASESVGRASAVVREELKRRKISEKKVNPDRVVAEEDEEVKVSSLRNSRSLSGSSRRSAKIKSSWTCYLDGPEPPAAAPSLSPPPSPLTPSPYTSPVKSSHPPLSPTSSTTSLVQNFSNSFRTAHNTTHNYFGPAPFRSAESLHFWEMVDSVGNVDGGCRGYLTSPLLSTPHTSHSSPPLHRTTTTSLPQRPKAAAVVSGKNGGGDHMISVAMVTTPGETPVSFQCTAQLTVSEVIKMGVASAGKGQRSPSSSRWLKVCGKDEYLDPVKKLVDYVYVHNCLKLSAEVRVQIVDKDGLPTSLACKLQNVSQSHATPTWTDASSFHSVSEQELNNLMDSYVAKQEKFRSVVESQKETPPPIPIPALVQIVISCVRLLCERLLYVEPPSLSDAIFNLRRACKPRGSRGDDHEGIVGGANKERSTEGESNDFSSKEAMPKSPVRRIAMATSDVVHDDVIVNEDDVVDDDNTGDIVSALELVRRGVEYLVSLYCLSLLPGYLPEWWAEPQDVVMATTMNRLFRVKICALHGIPVTEFRRYAQFQMEASIYHGGLLISKKTCSPPSKVTHSFFSSVVWNKWLNFGVPLSHLPRESRLCLTLHGMETGAGGDKTTWSRTPVAWVIQRLFDCEGVLIFSPRLLGMWGANDDVIDPLDSPYQNASNKSVLLELMFECSGERVICDDARPRTNNTRSPARQPEAPPTLHYRGLKKMADRDRFSSLSMEDEKLIWSNRFLLQVHLGSSPRGLPLLLLSAPHWRPPHRDDVWAILDTWPCHDPVHGLELLDPQFADGRIRETAVGWLSGLHDDDLCDFLPQLVQTVRHDCFEGSAMAQMLLHRAIESPRVAHALYWQLHILATATDERFKVRYQNMILALETLLGERLRTEFKTQVEFIEQLVAVAAVVKATRDAHRQTMLVHELQRVSERMVGEFRLPLSPSLLVRGIDFEASSFFNSNTVPLKISFLNSDPCGDNIDIIFKVGDDLRQDILVLQMIRLMEKIWLRAGLDLKMVTYDCVATGQDHGMLELVTDSSTLRTIQTERGVTGSFKDKPLSDWLMRHNTTETHYRKAVDNFTCSCAGYCVATYILGICDRHNDNIMVKKSGHMFHIDFGKILGNAQMFGNIKRDRVPFVLTRDMAYVINDGDRPTSRFQQFVDLCCTAYNELRRHTHTILSLLSLMLPSGLAELSSADDVLYVRDALLPGRSDAEATYAFTKHIEDSLGSMATQINFFIHNLAQLKFSSPQAPPTLLTFVPQAYSIETDGRISSAVIVAYYMKYYPDSHAVYQIQVTRPRVGSTTLFRRYREFDELHSRLVLCFPGDDLPSVPGKTYLPGKSRARETVERRLAELNQYLCKLLNMDPRISESDVIYTFLHCLIRDEQEKARMEEEGVNEGGAIAGRVKVHLMYTRRTQSLSVMIRHVRDLVPRDGSDSADPYVKMYLKPDVTKATKQKTKIAKRTLHPTYNETFTYKVPPQSLPEKSLELSVWDASIILNKQCLAVATVDLSTLQSELTSGYGCWVELYSPSQAIQPDV